MFKTVIYGLVLQVSFCQETNNNSYKNSYYFRIGKSANEFKVNNRIYFLNHNITDYEYPNGRVQNIRRSKEPETQVKPLVKLNSYLDDEWIYEPKNTSHTNIPLFIHKFYEKRTEDPSLNHSTRILFNTNRNESSSVIKLTLDSLKDDEDILDADLYFYWPLKNTSKIYKQSVVLRLYQFEQHDTTEFNESHLIQNPDVHKLFNVIYVSKAQKGWQTFKLKKPIDNWQNGEENLGLLLTISSYDDNKLIEIFNDTNTGIYSTFATIQVQKNDTNFDEIPSSVDLDEENNTQCQKTEWKITFATLNWDKFIISPAGFTTYDCAGRCNQAQNENNHVKFLNIFHKRSPCCVPVNYMPLPIMFYDSFQNIVIKNYKDIIVTKCGCR